MKAIVVPIEGEFRVQEFRYPVRWTEITDALGGYMLRVRLLSLNDNIHERRHGTLQSWPIMVVDEEGLLKNLPRNPRASALTGKIIVGKAFIFGEGYVDADIFEFTELPPEMEWPSYWDKFLTRLARHARRAELHDQLRSKDLL